jgi:hypothetical protein
MPNEDHKYRWLDAMLRPEAGQRASNAADRPLSDVFRDEAAVGDEAGPAPVHALQPNTMPKVEGPQSSATNKTGHGVGLRGIEAAAATPQQEARFGKMFGDLTARGDVAPFPEDLGLPNGPMDRGSQRIDSTTVFAVMTYFGQFLDHDVTFDPTSSLERQQDPAAVRNFRTPALELDNVYGGGPVASPFLYDQSKPLKMLLGHATDDPAEVDVPRNEQGVALIGDPRNDVNLMVSQLHVAFLKFHNAVVDQLSSIDGDLKDESPFEKAQRLVRWHYQWLVLHEFLPAIVGQETVDDILAHGRKLYTPKTPFIPVEFSVAAYRFGHSMVQLGYVINDGFGARLFPTDPNEPMPGLGRLRMDLRGGPIRLQERINWKLFVDTGATSQAGLTGTQFSSRIDTKLSTPLLNLPASIVPGNVPPALRSLAVRNLKRGVALKLPSGQDIARCVDDRIPGTRLLTDDELWGDLKASKFKGSAAPLWYYFLREAEVIAGGEQLGPVGARIVAEVLIGLLDLDPSAYRNVKPDWTPQVAGRKDPAKFTFPDFFRIAGTDVD